MGSLTMPTPGQEAQTAGTIAADAVFASSATIRAVPGLETILKQQPYAATRPGDLAPVKGILGDEEFKFFWECYGSDSGLMAPLWQELKGECLDGNTPAHFYFMIDRGIKEMSIYFEVQRGILRVGFLWPADKPLMITVA